MPAMLSDPTSPLIPSTPSHTTSALVPLRITLRDGSQAVILALTSPSEAPPRLSAHLCNLLNAEIDSGDTYPMTNHMESSAFRSYWFGNFAGVMLLLAPPPVTSPSSSSSAHGRQHKASLPASEVAKSLSSSDRNVWTAALAALDDDDPSAVGNWDEICLGTFYVKPNYPGRSSHVCNAGFLVGPRSRGKGVGRRLGEAYVLWAGRLGYKYSIFNLVYETNVPSMRIWDALGFQRVGRVKGAGRLKSYPDRLVDAIVYGRDLVDDGGKGPLEDVDRATEETMRAVEGGEVASV